MLDAARAIQGFVSGVTYHAYATTRLIRNAVERNLEILGEAAARVTDKTKAAHPEIPWRQIVAQRNVIVHEYGEIQDELLWKLATTEIPSLIARLEPLVPDPSSPDEPR